MNRNRAVFHLLHPRVQAKYVRFHPRTWYGHICMRAEVYGCNGKRWYFVGDYEHIYCNIQKISILRLRLLSIFYADSVYFYGYHGSII